MTRKRRTQHDRPASPKPQQGSAFGLRPHDWTEPDVVGHQFANPFEDPSVTVSPYLEDHLPADVAVLIERARLLLMVEASPLYPAANDSAVNLVLTAATNDIVALLRHVSHLDGRSAAHAARTLFEHAVTIHDLYEPGGPNTPERYEAHQHVTRRLVAQRRWWLTFLPAKQRRREEARLDRMQREADAALAGLTYPAGEFRRQWHQGNLFDRATRHGLVAGYDGYRILSAVIHGSAGGLGGIRRQIDGVDVHRVGMDLDLAAIAYSEGLWSWREFARKLHAETGRDEAGALVEAADDLMKCLPQVRETLAAIDKRLWPKNAPPRTFAVLAIYGQGRKLRWFLADQRTGTAIPAKPPDGEVPNLDRVLKRARTFDHDAFGGRPMTVTLEGVTVVPVSGAKPIPLTQLLVPRGHPGMLARPRRIRN